MGDAPQKSQRADDQPSIDARRAALALSAAGFGEFEMNLATDRLVISERMAELTGLPAGELPGSDGRVRRHVHPDDREALDETIAGGLAEHGRYEAEFRFTRPSDG